ncbi:MAG: hypothetical protein M1840_000614 [Geoglossum simile]|nr:MAG: hypothetical protein M1840_000614 [Geoglossum simile]
MANSKNDDWSQKYIDALGEMAKNSTYVLFDIKTSRSHTKPEGLFAELQTKEFPRSDVGWVKMLDSGSSWRIAVRQSRVKLFREICPWQITSSGDAGEVEGLVPGFAGMKV